MSKEDIPENSDRYEDSDRYSVTFGISITEQMRALLEEVAKEEQRSLASVIRVLLQEALDARQ